MTPATGIESQAPSDTGTPATALRPGFARSVTMIEPRPGWRMLDLRELWRYRDLAFVLAARDVKVRYKQTALGVVWVLVMASYHNAIAWQLQKRRGVLARFRRIPTPVQTPKPGHRVD